MIPKTFTALTVSNIDNGTTTFATPVNFTANRALQRTQRTVGANVFDGYGTQRTKRVPGTRQIKYLAVFSTAVLLNAHLNTLMVDDIGKKGALSYSGGDGHTYSQIAAVQDVKVRRLTDRDDETKAEITLVIEEVTLVTRD